ncbi:aspartyl-phosphate phosphatase Spo0E family protein [Psychrobacillus sp. OK032]|uniref:aspartyl-phosphate phosphatase Spo0E family protein n=1 Tax=Psychrobacillus sp. OK032 TaxID=1884358 RepID=UPI0008CACFCE|nr:aspartyl-phosphate phosphatase Spo0E family protein [Psychrobacillus sp. OK032]SER61751.1 Spo0E like sporulation regulatory protein [Psychrobacillus sp. OK032]
MVEKILNKVELTREKMIKAALEKGVSHKETIELSEELDRLLNEYEIEEKLK